MPDLAFVLASGLVDAFSLCCSSCCCVQVVFSLGMCLLSPAINWDFLSPSFVACKLLLRVAGKSSFVASFGSDLLSN